MADQYDVTTAGIGGKNVPVWAPGVDHPAATLVNGGTRTLYLDPTATAGTFGQPLSAGSSLLWDQDRALYACTAAGAGVLIVSDNAGAGFDSGSIAAQLIAQGLPQAIAAQVNLAGVPPVDQMTLIQTDARTLADGSPSFSLPVINVSGYQSLRMVFMGYGAGYLGLAERTITLAWFSDAGGTDQVAQDLITFPCAGPLVSGGMLTSKPNTRAVIPPRAPYLQITVGMTVLTGQTHQLATRVYGSFRSAPRASWTVNAYLPTATNYLTATDTAVSPVKAEFHGTAAAGTNYAGFPNVVIPGRVLLRYLVQAIATTPSNLEILDYSGTNIATVQFPVSTGPAFGSLEFWADRALQVVFQNQSSTATPYEFSLGFDAW